MGLIFNFLQNTSFLITAVIVQEMYLHKFLIIYQHKKFSFLRLNRYLINNNYI